MNMVAPDRVVSHITLWRMLDDHARRENPHEYRLTTYVSLFLRKGVTREPGGGECGDLLERAGLDEQVRGSGDDFHPRFAPQQLERLSIERRRRRRHPPAR
jgi:hypothetical protein